MLGFRASGLGILGLRVGRRGGYVVEADASDAAPAGPPACAGKLRHEGFYEGPKNSRISSINNNSGAAAATTPTARASAGLSQSPGPNAANGRRGLTHFDCKTSEVSMRVLVGVFPAVEERVMVGRLGLRFSPTCGYMSH